MTPRVFFVSYCNFRAKALACKGLIGLGLNIIGKELPMSLYEQTQLGQGVLGLNFLCKGKCRRVLPANKLRGGICFECYEKAAIKEVTKKHKKKKYKYKKKKQKTLRRTRC